MYDKSFVKEHLTKKYTCYLRENIYQIYAYNLDFHYKTI